MARVPSEAARIVGAQIKAHRTQRGWSVDELAVATRIDSSNVRGFEAGRAMVSLRTLCRLAEALEIQPGELLTGVRAADFD